MIITATRVCKRLQDNGFQAVFAGGCVRDILLKQKYNDIDIATNATPEQVEKYFNKVIPIGESFGVMQVHANNFQFEVATFRNDSEYLDGRRPKCIAFSSMEEDALRRDFTINALFYDPISKKTFDFVNGKKDLENKMLRFVGDPNKRLEEDQLRALRAIRFASKLGFVVEPNSKEALRHAILGKLSAERIKSELDKMLLIKKPSVAFNMVNEFGLLKKILPEVYPLVHAKHNRTFHVEGEPWEHTLIVLDNVRKKTNNLNVLWGALLHDVGKPATEKHEIDRITNHGHGEVGASISNALLRRLRASNEQIKEVEFLVSNHMRIKNAGAMKKSKIARLKAEKYFDNLKLLAIADSKASPMSGRLVWVDELDKVEEFKKLPTPFITGIDLIAMGMEPGPKMGELLTNIMDLQLEKKITSKKEALDVVRKKCGK